jgi:hypothetical protein
MRLSRSTLAAVTTAMIASTSFADVPFQQLADFGRGASPFDVNAQGTIVGGARSADDDSRSLPVVWDSPTATPVALPTVNGGSASAINSNGQIVSVYSTKRRWTAIDVYVQTCANFFQGPFVSDELPAIGVLVFAVIGSTRTLVRTGRLWLNEQGTAKLVCSVHDVLAEHFDVMLDLSSVGAGTLVAASSSTGPAQATVSIVASDAATSQRDNAGVVPAFCSSVGGEFPAMIASVQQVRLLTAAAPTLARFELVGLDAVSDVAGRWLHIYDQTAAVVNGQRPIFAIGVPHNAGAIADNMPSPFVVNEALRAFRFRFGIRIAVSSTPRTTTPAAANEVAYQVWYR